MIGARWKCSNAWSRSILIAPLPFYVLVYDANACIGGVDEVDLTSDWCISPLSIVDTYITIPCRWTSKQGFGPPRKYIGTKRLNPHFGAHGEEETPVPIPNTEVKLPSGDYTAFSGKLARCRII